MIGNPLSVYEILKEIQRDQVKLPEIQRDYVWHGPQVSKLLDSLYHKYPVGQILLWDTTILPTTKNIKGGVETNLPSVGNPKIVLDGQQRLTSLRLALGNVPDDDEVDVWFNLESEQFQRFQRRMKNDPLWVSVRDVVVDKADELDIMERIGSSGGPDVKSEKGRLYRDRLKALSPDFPDGISFRV